MATAILRQRHENNKRDKTDVELRVIGAGLPRTGTLSLKTALEILGFGPCHHMVDLMREPDRIIGFIQAYDGENVDFRQLLKGYRSTVDAPTVDFYKEIQQAYPNAKIILSVRDSNEKWFESFQNTIGLITCSRFYRFAVYPLRFLRLQSQMGEKTTQKWIRDYGSIDSKMHEKHNQRVINENKRGDVLVYNVKEGWEPLCRFLEVDVPENIPFPNVNDTKEFQRRITLAKILGLCLWAGIGFVFTGFSYFFLRKTYLI
ncbi:unnamed protein product [Adineta ricciae]|uniref:Uncharacterized protein n=1 Tax=Adineta ricciae TaxID=249248 RepID=A0A814IC42_ADIRI|nr:unnamed protein product [Adineta ricciae]CAF1435642.1 unnamed protein product [Adineta ricciae]